jgi:hypothetical protein
MHAVAAADKDVKNVKNGAKGVGENKYATMVEQMGGISKLIRLQQHQDDKVYVLALGILETYFPRVLEEDHRTVLVDESIKSTTTKKKDEQEQQEQKESEQQEGPKKVLTSQEEEVRISLCGQPPRTYRFKVGQRVECLVMESEQGGVWEQGVVEELDYHHMCGHCRMLHQSAYLIKLDSGGTCKASLDEDSMIRKIMPLGRKTLRV